MAVTNTGIIERTITGVNESDLFLDSESTSVATNTGVVERSVVGVHDANFVHPIGDEEVVNGDFSNGSTDWFISGQVTIGGGVAYFDSDGTFTQIAQNLSGISGKSVKVVIEVTEYNQGTLKVLFSGGAQQNLPTSVGTYTLYFSNVTSNTLNIARVGGVTNIKIDNISVKEMLVNRESTTTNTGIVERAITGSNESELWLDAESTSVVNNTGIVERPITGVNESDALFPDNTISNIVNIAGLISSLIADLKARATTFENEDATRNILINLQNC